MPTNQIPKKTEIWINPSEKNPGSGCLTSSKTNPDPTSLVQMSHRQIPGRKVNESDPNNLIPKRSGSDSKEKPYEDFLPLGIVVRMPNNQIP